jgi:hypothetical protein
MVVASIEGDHEAMDTQRRAYATDTGASNLRKVVGSVGPYFPALVLIGAGSAMIATGPAAGIGWLLLIAGAADASRVAWRGRRARDSAPGPAARPDRSGRASHGARRERRSGHVNHGVRRRELLVDVPPLRFGSMPNEHGNLILSPKEREEIVNSEARTRRRRPGDDRHRPAAGIGWQLLIAGVADAARVVLRGRRARDSAPRRAARRDRPLRATRSVRHGRRGADANDGDRAALRRALERRRVGL